MEHFKSVIQDLVKFKYYAEALRQLEESLFDYEQYDDAFKEDIRPLKAQIAVLIQELEDISPDPTTPVVEEQPQLGQAILAIFTTIDQDYPGLSDYLKEQEATIDNELEKILADTQVTKEKLTSVNDFVPFNNDMYFQKTLDNRIAVGFYILTVLLPILGFIIGGYIYFVRENSQFRFDEESRKKGFIMMGVAAMLLILQSLMSSFL